MADIFVSYTSNDGEWAQWIEKELETLGHTAHRFEPEIEAGHNIRDWMEARFDEADKVLCVVSKNYLNAPHSKSEYQAAAWKNTQKPGFCLPVVVERCELPGMLDPIKNCKLYGVAEETARTELREYLVGKERGPVRFPETQALAKEAPKFPGKELALSNIPYAAPLHFMGREDELADIGNAFGRVAVVALVGMRGAGKSTLAAAYADRQQRDYRVTWWIRADTSEGMTSDLVGSVFA